MIDLARCAITVALGHWTVGSAQVIEAGQPVLLNASDEIALTADGDTFFGIAKWDKRTATTATIIEEAVTLGADGVYIAMAHANIVSGSERVTTVADPSTALTITTDYLINYTNGTLAVVVSGALGADDPVLVSYRYTMTQQEVDTLRGANYQNLQDDTVGSGAMTVIQDYAIIYTDQYDTTLAYAVGGSVYVTSGSLFGSAGVNTKVGKIISAPTAADPLLGIQIG